MKLLMFMMTAAALLLIVGPEAVDVFEPLGKGLPYKHG